MLCEIALELEHLLTVLLGDRLPHSAPAASVTHGRNLIVELHASGVMGLRLDDKDEVFDCGAARYERFTLPGMEIVLNIKPARLGKVPDDDEVYVLDTVAVQFEADEYLHMIIGALGEVRPDRE